MTIAEQLLAEGMAKGMAEGKAKGMAEGKAEAVVLVLESRGLHVDERVQGRLRAMAIDELDVMLRRATSVSSVDELLDS